LSLHERVNDIGASPDWGRTVFRYREQGIVTMPQIQPTLFISHGAPDILISQQASVESLREIGARLSLPRAVIVVSAHWTRNPVGITSGDQLTTIHDFSGFPDELYVL